MQLIYNGLSLLKSSVLTALTINNFINMSSQSIVIYPLLTKKEKYPSSKKRKRKDNNLIRKEVLTQTKLSEGRGRE
jgi:hypothetical protein